MGSQEDNLHIVASFISGGVHNSLLCFVQSEQRLEFGCVRSSSPSPSVPTLPLHFFPSLRREFLVTRGNARVVLAVRNASLMPRRLEHVHCAYSNTSAIISWLQAGDLFEEIVKKLSSLTLLKSDLQDLS